MASDVASLLRQTLDPAQSKAAEAGLRQAEAQPGFASNLLQLISLPSIELSTRQAGVLFFKNFVKRHWTDEDTPSLLAESDKILIKKSIIPFMTQMPASLRIQVGEAVTIIADSDFPANWEGLIDDLISNISLTDMTITNGVLQTAHSIFKRWRAQFRTDTLFTEIAFVLSKFCTPFLSIMQHTDKMIQQNAHDRAKLDVLLETMLLLLKIFYDLNCQDIPEFFEDNMSEFMEILHRYLTYTNSTIDPPTELETISVIQRLKASICEAIELYTHRYEEIFPMLPQFINTTWTLLTQTSLEPKNDILVSKALSLLTCVVKIPRHAALFESETTLSQFIELIVLPNMSLRENDLELFEDDPIEFIRRDLEGSDSDTRRRSATEFVRGLVERFEQKLTSIVLKYVDHYLMQYSANPANEWRSKDTALYLITSVAVKGVVTKTGVSSTNFMIDVVQFFSTNLLPDLQTTSSEKHPILIVDAIKFAYTFRNQLTRDQLNTIFPLLAQHLSSSNYVIFTYAAVMVDALLTMRRDDRPLFDKTALEPVLGQLLQNLFSLIERGTTPEKLAENDFLMRCVMRILIVAQDRAAVQASMVIGHLNRILLEISRNPSNPKFNHYLFESYGSLIRYVGPLSPEAVTQLEALLMGPLLSLLQNDVAEFIPYVFQLLSQLLESHDSIGLPQTYQQLLKPILTPSLWDSRGNVPALVRLIQAFMKRGSTMFVESGLIEPVLGIFQKLISSKISDGFGFDLLETIYSCIPMQDLATYNHQIFVLLLTRLNNSRTEKYTLRFCLFLYYLSALASKAGPDFLIKTMQSIQNGIFSQIFSGIVMPNTQKIVAPVEAKTVSIGLTNLLKSAIIIEHHFPALWTELLNCQLKFLELPAQVSLGDGELFDVDLDDGFQANFSGLRTASKSVHDPWISIPDPKVYFVEQLNLERAGANRFGPVIASALPVDAQSVLRSYGVQL